MLNNKVKTLLFIFLILFCIAAVNAEEIDDNIDTTSNMDIIDVKSENYIATLDDTTTESVGNFTELNDVIEKAGENREIKLNKSYIYNSSGDSPYQNGIVISKNLTIDGQGYTIDGNQMARIFQVTSGSLTIKNINLINGYTSDDGGAIYAAGNIINVINSTFINNTARDEGGAIFTSRCILMVTDSTFNQNNASWGGAIRSNNATATINNSKFNNNIASYGGATSSDTDLVTIINSTFVENSGTVRGGAVHNEFIEIINSTFINNTAATWGGALVIGLGNITGSTFISNNAPEGGAMYIAYGNVTIDKSSFISNNATSGGAIHYIDTHFGTFSYDVSITIMNSNFKDNHGDYGDDIYTAYNTTVLNNTYTEKSYANIYAINTIVNCTVVSVLRNVTYYVTPDGEFKLFAEVLADGASVYGYNITMTDGKNSYNATYKGNGIYEITGNITANFTVKSYTATLNNMTEDPNFVIKNGTVSTEKQNVTVEVELDEVVAGENITGNITLKDSNDKVANITGEVTVEIDGRNYTINVTEGRGHFNIEDEFEPGNYTMKVIFPGNEEYNPANGTANFTIENAGVILEVNNLTKYYGNGSQFIVILTDSKGNPIADQTINITLNGVAYTFTTDSEGKIFMDINLLAGIYNATVTYGDINMNATITILPTIEAEDLVKYFLNGTQYYAKFYNVDGTPLANSNVTFNIHGIMYTRTTDANGIAKLNINLNPGEYIITAYNPVNNESKANIITVLTTIIGEDVVKFYRNGTQYYVYVLDLDGKPLVNSTVTFNIHGVFYTRTTDANGIAKLNINLNPGKYIITAWNSVNNESYSNNITVYNVVESEDLEMTTSARKPFKVTILGEQGKPLANAEVTFNIHGIFYHKTTDANGQISLDINLIAGKYIITTYYNEYAVSNTILVK